MSDHVLNEMPKSFFDQLLVVKDDPALRASFIQVLAMGTSSQQVRVSKLKAYLQDVEAPKELLDFVEYLQNDQVAHQVLEELTS